MAPKCRPTGSILLTKTFIRQVINNAKISFSHQNPTPNSEKLSHGKTFYPKNLHSSKITPTFASLLRTSPTGNPKA